MLPPSTLVGWGFFYWGFGVGQFQLSHMKVDGLEYRNHAPQNPWRSGNFNFSITEVDGLRHLFYGRPLPNIDRSEKSPVVGEEPDDASSR